jgi:hypothetical protein
VVTGDLRDRIAKTLQASDDATTRGHAGVLDAYYPMADALLPLFAEVEANARREAADERAAKQIASEAADRFRDVLSEVLGYPDENPGDDALVVALREHFGKTGPEPRRWRDFVTSARAVVDQIEGEVVTDDLPGMWEMADLTGGETDTTPPSPCRLGYIEYDGFQYCHEHFGWVIPGSGTTLTCDRAVNRVRAALGDTTPTDGARQACLDAWPEAENGAYHPSCCRFPKSCSVPS